MKIAIEAQRIFRPNKHGMDFVALETIRCLQRLDTEERILHLHGRRSKTVAWRRRPNMHIINAPLPERTRCGNSGRCRGPWPA